MFSLHVVRLRPSNTGDKLRASNMLNARLLHPLISGIALLPVASHSDAIGLDDPQASCERLLGQLAHETLANLENERLVLPRETKYDETWVLVRRVCSNVAEAAIERY